jgi:hypothetical protein
LTGGGRLAGQTQACALPLAKQPGRVSQLHNTMAKLSNAFTNHLSHSCLFRCSSKNAFTQTYTLTHARMHESMPQNTRMHAACRGTLMHTHTHTLSHSNTHTHTHTRTRASPAALRPAQRWLSGPGAPGLSA